jgi:hypothetical protein
MSKSAFLNAIEAYMLTGRYSLRTIKTYQYWIKSFIIFHGKAHPNSMGRDEIELFSAQVDGVTIEDEIVYLNVEGCINCADLVFGFMSKAYNVALEQFPKQH